MAGRVVRQGKEHSLGQSVQILRGYGIQTSLARGSALQECDLLVRGRRNDSFWTRGFRRIAAGALWSAAFAAGFGWGLPAAAGEPMVERRGDAPADSSVVQVAQDNTNRLSLFLEDESALGYQSAEAIVPAPAIQDDAAGLSLFLDDEWTPGPQTSEAPALEGPDSSTLGTIETPEADGASMPNASLDVELIQHQEITINADSGSGLYLGHSGGEIAKTQPTDEGAASDATEVQEAQFQLPQPSPEGEEPAPQLPSRLVYEYGYGSESEVTYRTNPDLNRRVRDNALIVTPELNGHVTYRPTDWLETTLEMVFEREFPVREEHRITLPNGEIETSEDRQFSLLVDQAFVTLKDFTDPLEFTIGRRNFEDNRHWLYDTSMDGGVVLLKYGKFRVEASVGRESWVDGDLLDNEQTTRINTYMLYTRYRGIEDIQLAGYTIFRDDRDGEEGRPLWVGVSSQGMVSENFSYWTELAYMTGEDEMSRDFSAYAFDVGGTYRFTGLPLNPNVTLGFALGTGDGNPDSNKSNEFRQTGLQSNEIKFAGVSEFKVYGEALDPELSNLKIFTAGLGIRPAHNVSVDFVYHRYWLDEIADEPRNSALTALMNQDDTQQSKDVGSAFDIVIGFRSLFGIRRLGVDLRAGVFFPGDAFRVEEPGGSFRNADRGISLVTKFWW